MNTLAARTSCGIYGVVIGDGPLKEIERICREAGDEETGGILVGRYTPDRSTAIVREATPPPTDSQKGRSWFARGVTGLRQLLRRRWRSKERRYYIGEWHFHPATVVEPSADDLDQMLRIGSTKEYSCKEPVLLIFGRPAGQGCGLAARAFVFPAGLRPVEMRLENLSPPFCGNALEPPARRRLRAPR
jgi:integrative and conjugative element protein (TIGR02256 family)